MSLVVAMSRNGVIGRNNQLPWRLPADLKYFKQLTMDHAVIMGRKTFDSIGKKPLPGRTNIVITRQTSSPFEGAVTARSLDEALAIAAQHDRATHHKGEVFVLGGAEIFREALPRAGRLYVTLVDAEVDGDVCFPSWDRNEWRLRKDEAHAADDRHAYAMRFQVWEPVQ